MVEILLVGQKQNGLLGLLRPVAMETEKNFLRRPEGTAIRNGVDDHTRVAVLGPNRWNTFIFLHGTFHGRVAFSHQLSNIVKCSLLLG